MKRIVRSTLNEHRLTEKDKRELAKLAAMPDSSIDFSDIPEATEEFWKNAVPFQSLRKKMKSTR